MNTQQPIPFRRFGTMIDCSRNAVMTPETLKRWIDLTSDLGYTTLLLYTEDTYEVDENPYFGYFRGRYSQDEIRAVDAYAKERGMELIPCIQTLAHLNAITRWNVYNPIIDTGDILLAGDDNTYALIDKMFQSIAESYSSKTVNIGMDEAYLIGRGKYYDIHGDTDRSKLLIDHIRRVAEIGKKYGLELIMWSDMFFRLVVGTYYDAKVTINEEIKALIPDNVHLIYWDYYSTDKKHYDSMFKAHEKIKEGTWFAGGLWSWMGYAPHNQYSMRATRAALTGCRKYHTQDVFLTMWGDDGGECSKFSLLPALFYAAEIARGNTRLSDIKAAFKEKYGISFDAFLLLDLPGTPNDSSENVFNAERYLLYNDPFTGVMDSTLAGGEDAQFAACARRLAYYKKHPRFGYLFAAAQALCEVLAVKAELGLENRSAYEAYQNGDKNALTLLIKKYALLEKKLTAFHRLYRKQWFTENKGYGFDVQDLRLGGLLQRVKSCRERLELLESGTLSRIEELEEQPLDFWGQGENWQKKPIFFQSWYRNATSNMLTFPS